VPREFTTSNLSSLNTLPRSSAPTLRAPILEPRLDGERFHKRFGHLPLEQRINLAATHIGPQRRKKGPIRHTFPPPLPLISKESHQRAQEEAELRCLSAAVPFRHNYPLEARIADPAPTTFAEPIVPVKEITVRRSAPDRAAVLEKRACKTLTRLEVFWVYKAQLNLLSEHNRIYLETLKDQVTWIINFANFAAQWPQERLNQVFLGLNVFRQFRIEQIRVNYYTLVINLRSVDPKAYFTGAHIPHRVFKKGDKYKEEDHMVAVDDHPLGW
jgi:hypothetical protein